MCTLDKSYFGTAPHVDSEPFFQLNNIAAREVIEIQLDFLSTSGAVTPTDMILQILDSTGAALANFNQPAPFGTTTPISITAGFPTYHTFWTAPYAGSFILSSTSTQTISAFQLYYLNVWRANGGGSLVKAVDALRQSDTDGTGKYLKYLYIEATRNVRISTTRTATGNVDLFPVTVPAYTVGAAAAAATTAGDDKIYTSLTTGYYLTIFNGDGAKGAFTGSAPTDPYTCPYDTSYADPRGIFTGCTGTTGNAPTISTAAPTIPIFGDSLIQLTDKTDSVGRYKMTGLAQNDVVTFTIRMR